METQTPFLSTEQIETLRETVARDQKLSNTEFQTFLFAAERSRLDPFRRQIHVIKRAGKMTIQTGIDGYRSIADRTGLYAGSDDYLFDGGMTQFEMLNADRKQPMTAVVTVYKIVAGQRVPFAATAGWSEYHPKGGGFMWDKMPFLMCGKTAESLALRKAFPNELSGIYTDEEMAQANANGSKPPFTATKQTEPPNTDGERKERLLKQFYASANKEGFYPYCEADDLDSLEKMANDEVCVYDVFVKQVKEIADASREEQAGATGATGAGEEVEK